MRTRTACNYSFLISAIAFFVIVIESFNINHCVTPNSYECPSEDVTFYLYSKANNYREYKLDMYNLSTIEYAPLSPNSPIKFLVHGYTGHKDYTPNMEIRPAYFKHPDPVNIISIDYNRLVQDGCYPSAVNNVPFVSKCAAHFLDTFFQIREDFGLHQLHVIGMSLGAQVSGQLKNYLKTGLIPRITGLDAASPLFYTNIVPDQYYLNQGDADVVDAIHTNGDFKGKKIPYADIDFYANEGGNQPWCHTNSSCSHAASAVYYAESINSPVGFWARGCSYFTRIVGFCAGVERDKWNIFGEYTDLSVRGSFYFITNNTPPYAMGRDGGD